MKLILYVVKKNLVKHNVNANKGRQITYLIGEK